MALRFAACLLAFALITVAAPAAASDIDTYTGCDAKTVEICTPVCVTAPCPAYVCVHTSAGSVCRELWV